MGRETDSDDTDSSVPQQEREETPDEIEQERQEAQREAQEERAEQEIEATEEREAEAAEQENPDYHLDEPPHNS